MMNSDLNNYFNRITMKIIKIKIHEPWPVATINAGKTFKGRIIERIDESFLFEFDNEIEVAKGVFTKFLIGKLDRNNSIDLMCDKVTAMEISLAIYPSYLLTLPQRPGFEDMRGNFLSGEITT